MSDLLLERGKPRSRLGRILVVFTGSGSDERALDTALELAACGGGSLQAILILGEFRGYSVVPGVLDRQRADWRASFGAHAFELCERAINAGTQLPLELVEGDGSAWLSHWNGRSEFSLIVLADRRRRVPSPVRLAPGIRRGATCPVILVK